LIHIYHSTLFTGSKYPKKTQKLAREKMDERMPADQRRPVLGSSGGAVSSRSVQEGSNRCVIETWSLQDDQTRKRF
jgi:hypothetical protein